MVTAHQRDETVAPATRSARTVLYVEDSLSNVKLVEEMLLQRPEVTLLIAMQGALALDIAREQRPDVVLLDLHLPDMSGEDVLRELRADVRTEATSIVVVSADATPGQVRRLLANGATQYLTKPFDIPTLLNAIDSAPVALRRSPRTRPSTSAPRWMAGRCGCSGSSRARQPSAGIASPS